MADIGNGQVLALLLRLTYAGSFGICEDGRRDNIEADMILLPQDRIDSPEPLEGGDMGKHQWHKFRQHWYSCSHQR